MVVDHNRRAAEHETLKRILTWKSTLAGRGLRAEAAAESPGLGTTVAGGLASAR